jgi:hypothetical protein
MWGPIFTQNAGKEQRKGAYFIRGAIGDKEKFRKLASHNDDNAQVVKRCDQHQEMCHAPARPDWLSSKQFIDWGPSNGVTLQAGHRQQVT